MTQRFLLSSDEAVDISIGEKHRHTHTYTRARAALKSERHMKWTIRCMAHSLIKRSLFPSREKWRNFNQVTDQRRQGRCSERRQPPCAPQPAPAGRVATYTNSTMSSTTTASVGSTTVVICRRASCMACFRSFLSRDVSFLGFPLSCRIFPAARRARLEPVPMGGPRPSGQGARSPAREPRSRTNGGKGKRNRE